MTELMFFVVVTIIWVYFAFCNYQDIELCSKNEYLRLTLHKSYIQVIFDIYILFYIHHRPQNLYSKYLINKMCHVQSLNQFSDLNHQYPLLNILYKHVAIEINP